MIASVTSLTTDPTDVPESAGTVSPAAPAHTAAPADIAGPADTLGSGGTASVARASDGALLAADPAGLVRLSRLVDEVVVAAQAGLRRRTGPLPAVSPAQLAAQIDADLAGGVLPRRGRGASALLALARRYAEATVDLSHPAAAAHLQPPALTVAVAADVLANAFNASVDTWDSGPYAVELERHVIRTLNDLVGFHGAGVLTSGGTASNLQALLLARDLAPGDRRKVVLCSEIAHFSVARACGVLGLGDGVRSVPVDGSWRMRAEALDATVAGLPPDEQPIAVVATAGTTDFGSIDPLRELAAVAARHGVRLHVDAAYGGGALFSDRLRPLLDGIELADSVTIDLHKTAWQPAAASALLVRHDFAVSERVAYLNPGDDGEAGYDGLLGYSLATTRRADALKVAVTFGVLGRDGIGALFDHCHDLARYAAARIAADPRLELIAEPVLSTVVFRYCPGGSVSAPRGADAVNAALRRRLMRTGRALVGRTTVPGVGVCLKFTLLNPQARTSDIDALLDAVGHAGSLEESHDD
jgi:L-2,4-diaminobutyrate decarboxylase